MAVGRVPSSTGAVSWIDFSHAGSVLAMLSAELAGVYESHHFYSVLVYFRFREPHYALSRVALVLMEMLAP